MAPPSAILESPSAERNKCPIWDVLSSKVLPLIQPVSRVLEIAAGCGVHTMHFATHLLSLSSSSTQGNFTWLPTDPDSACRESINERTRTCRDVRIQRCVQRAQSLTLNEQGAIEDNNLWSERNKYDLIVNINMIHISPWSATIGLMHVGSQMLRDGGVLYCYGPYKENGTAVESNLAFDRSLRSRDSSWGVRDLEDVIRVAAKHGLVFKEKVEMPANNLSLIFIRKVQST